MLLFFLKNRRGSITIMLSFLLIAVLSINSSFMETARYRGMERLYKELEESAAFSVLSQYDRDLFKNYGLLAMEEEVDEETFLKYLLSDLNSELTGVNGADSFLQISEEDIDFDKLYDLAQEEVLAMQINEFCTYRAPVNFINNTLNIEDIIKELVKDLEKSLPILNVFKNLCSSAQKIFDTFEKLSAYKDKSQSLEDQWNEYENCVDRYNAAVRERDDYIEAEHTEEEDYEGTLQSKCDAVESRAAEVRNSLENTKSALGEFYESYQEFVDSFGAMQASNVKSVISGAKADAAALPDEQSRKNAKDMIEGMEKAYQDSENMFTRIINYMDSVTERQISTAMQSMEDQKLLLAGKGNELGEISYVQEVKNSNFLTIIRLTLETSAQILSIVNQWRDAFATIGELLDIMSELSAAGFYNVTYNNTLSSSFVDQLPGRQHNGYRLVSVSNPFAAEDKNTLNTQIEKAKEAAAYTGFDTEVLNTNDKGEENLLLQSAMGRMLDAQTAFRAECEGLDSAWGMLNIIWKLQGVVRTLIELIESIINLIQVFIQAASPQMLQDMLYQKFNAVTYASEMFSNRVTDTGSDKRLNGSSFPDYSAIIGDGKSPGLGYFVGTADSYFKMANAEYIVHGNAAEIENQSYVFTMMLVFRMVCNIPGMLANKSVMDVVTSLCESLVGIIVAVIVVLLVLLLEGWLDMLFMVCGEEVKIIKTESYITFENGGVSKDFLDRVKDMTKNIAAVNLGKEKSKTQASGKEEKEEGKNYGKEYADSLLEWGYKDHLFLLLLLFVPSQVIYARSADLIEMQMKHEKFLKGEDFNLKDMATYVRIKSSVTYTPLLPIPVIPGLNQDGLKITNMHYSGY